MRLQETFTNVLSEAVVESSDEGPTIIRNVALAGLTSRNGYTYAAEAFLNAIPKYKNKSVYIDHAAKPVGRSVRDLAGTIINPRFEHNRMMGDIEIVPGDAGNTLSNLAKSQPPGVGMSHVVMGTKNKAKTLVESIEDVISIDVVTDPASTKTFSEQSKEDDMTEKTVELLESQLEKLDEKLEASRTSAQEEVKELTGKLVEKNDELAKLQESSDGLTDELKEAKAKLDEFEVKETLAVREQDIEKELDAAGLKDKEVLTETFMGQLRCEEDQKKRKELIDDRKKLIDAASGGASFITERRSQSKDFDPKKLIEQTNIYA